MPKVLLDMVLLEKASRIHQTAGPKIFFEVTMGLIINSQNISRRVVYWIFINISPSNILRKFVLVERYHQKRQTVLAAMTINGLNQHMGDPLRSLSQCATDLQMWEV